jgi:hypothetical protein
MVAALMFDAFEAGSKLNGRVLAHLAEQLILAICDTDVRKLARQRLPQSVFDFIDGGAKDEFARRPRRSLASATRRQVGAVRVIQFLAAELRTALTLRTIGPDIFYFQIGKREHQSYASCTSMILSIKS